MDKLRGWLEVLGLFGVIASLVFVGLQLKQDREIAITSAYQARTAIAVEALGALAANETAMRAMAKARYGDPDMLLELPGFAAPITALELGTAGRAMGTALNLADNSYYQYQAGFLPEDHWLAVRSLLKWTITNNPFWRLVAAQRPNNHRPEFNAMLDEILAEIEAETN